MVNQNEKIKHLTPFLTSCHPISKRFFNVVADNNRLNLLPNMIASFASLMQAHRGEVNVVITSVKPLDKTMMDRIQQALKKGNFLTKQQTMVISNKLNPAILGGMIVEIGDHTLDFSSVTKMAKLSKALFSTLMGAKKTGFFFFFFFVIIILHLSSLMSSRFLLIFLIFFTTFP
ncbi:ATP synthase F0 subcomplex subunit OSCP atp5 [Coelomomyces lativittatus]|nr:ATP synthase F0 subcomplex subunit OSCP atp5 [Coelomomyces lativittatus]